MAQHISALTTVRRRALATRAWASSASARRHLPRRPGRQSLRRHRHRLLSRPAPKAHLRSPPPPHGTASPGADATRIASVVGATSSWHAPSACNTTGIAQRGPARVNGTTRVTHAFLARLRLPVLRRAHLRRRSRRKPRPLRIRPPCHPRSRRRRRARRLPPHLHTCADMTGLRSEKASASGTTANQRNANPTSSSFGPTAASSCSPASCAGTST